jgi:parallel beta-helix repeat protein
MIHPMGGGVMQTRLWWLALVLALLFGSSGAAWADGEFYVIAGGGAPGTKIGSLPCEIKNSGFYYLTGNLTYSGTGNAITVSADNITIDLMGFTLSYIGATDGVVGIFMNERTNVEVRNGTVRDFTGDGIYESNFPNIVAANHRMVNVRVLNNKEGIRLYSSNNLVKNCTAANNTDAGIWIASGNVMDCVSFNNKNGIVNWGPGCVLNNSSYNNTQFNFSLGSVASTSILVDRNSAYGLNPNYVVVATGVLITANNAGTP